MSKKTIAIIGGGAAGLAAAITAARAGAKVTVLEHMDRVGRKILSTGNGRCNYTNARVSAGCYNTGDPETVRSVIEKYPVERILSFFEEIGVVPWQRDGYYYPASGQASAVLDCLRAECQRLNVKILCNIQTEKIEVFPFPQAGHVNPASGRERFRVVTDQGTWSCDRLILACGGQAAPFTGSDGSGYELAKSLGHRVCAPFPSLTGLKADSRRFKSLAGIRARAAVTLTVDGHPAAGDTGELQLTENGLSGIVVFQISHQAVEAFLKRKQTEIHINFLPDSEQEKVFDFLKRRQKTLSHKELQDWGIGLFHKKLWMQFVKEAGLSLAAPAGSMDDHEIRRLEKVITDFTVPVIGYLGFDRAQVTAGGVDLREINPETLESLKTAGAYLAGELLDVDGICGGYNLHWAWASGMLAGKSAARQ